MEIPEGAAELLAVTHKGALHFLSVGDMRIACYIFCAALNEDEAESWGEMRYAAMTTYAAGYIAGVRARKQKRKAYNTKQRKAVKQ